MDGLSQAKRGSIFGRWSIDYLLPLPREGRINHATEKDLFDSGNTASARHLPRRSSHEYRR